MIRTYQHALSVLKDKNYTNARADFLLNPWEKDSGVRYERIRNFHSSWLMYSDGRLHEETRRLVLSALTPASEIDSTSAILKLDNYLQAGSLKESHAEEVALVWHRDFLGLSTAQQIQIFSMADQFLQFFFFDQVPEGGITTLEDAVTDLEQWFQQQRFADGKPLHGLIKSGLNAGVVLNVIIDSYEPLYCALTTLFLNIAKIEIHPDQAGEAVSELLRLHPPFRYINRMPPDNQPKVSIDLFETNRDPDKFDAPEEFRIRPGNKHLSFGFGKHACPGGKSSMSFLTDVCRYLLLKKKDGSFSIDSGSMTNDAGFCKAEKLSVSFSKCPFHHSL